FEEMCGDLMQRIKNPFQRALEDAKLKTVEVDEVVLVGGATRMPMVQELVKKLTNKEPNRTVNPDEVVAVGAAIQAGILGGGTFDVSILELTGNVFQVVATGGDMFLGGADFDSRIEDWLLDQFKKKSRIDLADEPAAVQRVRNAAERAKIELSLLAHTEVRIPNLLERRGKGIDLEIAIDRETLNRLTQDLVARTIDVVDKLLAESGIDKNEIDEVIPVGGQTRMPLVVETITRHFGKPPRKGIHPDECVALGAALLGDSLSQIDAVTLLDTLSRPIGIADPAGTLQVVIDKNVHLPRKAVLPLKTTKDQQAALEVEVYQGEAGTRVAQCDYLGTLIYSGVPEAGAGEVTVTIEFTVDAEGMLAISASNDRTGAPQTIRLATLERPVADTSQIIQERPGKDATQVEPEAASSGLRGLVRSILKR
ncbi:MAG: Hsp70 family protein, partial [Deltaproteobacteria bacterium]|nr:Hsp70 family protein [Deltaproteobacteria bacterium]